MKENQVCFFVVVVSHRIHVWYIHLHLVEKID